MHISCILIILIFTTTNLQRRVLQNFRKNKVIVLMKPDKRNEVVFLDQKLYDNTIQEIISDTSKFRKLNEDSTLKREASLQCFVRMIPFLMKLNVLNCILLALFLFVFMELLKCTNSLLVIHSLNFVQLFDL